MTKASTFYKRNYTNGYQAKVEYWSTELAIYTKYEAQDKMLMAKKKLDYFVTKQVEYLNKKHHNLLAEIKTIQK